eukprot:g49287.t1
MRTHATRWRRTQMTRQSQQSTLHIGNTERQPARHEQHKTTVFCLLWSVLISEKREDSKSEGEGKKGNGERQRRIFTQVRPLEKPFWVHFRPGNVYNAKRCVTDRPFTRNTLIHHYYLFVRVVCFLLFPWLDMQYQFNKCM